uniref:ATP synthase complex subunit 8 n=1 Tax=Balta sp. Cairns, Australia TaxID=2093455 RepID=A0A2P1H923_9NEOP|nr:ATP synthase F0 subunit 8 [Balta sp. Cairns, Australia]
MPQMMPMNWLILYLLFLIIFIMFNITNYYIIIYSTKKSIKMMMKSKMSNWKW